MRTKTTDLTRKLKSIVGLVRTAAEEYEVGVKGRKVTNAQEYQDAWGFTQVAKSQMSAFSENERQRLGAGYQQILGELDALTPAWPSVVSPDSLATDASLL
jgi:hypothetical protein